MCELLIGIAQTKANVTLVLVALAIALAIVTFLGTHNWIAAVIVGCVILVLTLVFRIVC